MPIKLDNYIVEFVGGERRKGSFFYASTEDAIHEKFFFAYDRVPPFWIILEQATIW